MHEAFHSTSEFLYNELMVRLIHYNLFISVSQGLIRPIYCITFVVAYIYTSLGNKGNLYLFVDHLQSWYEGIFVDKCHALQLVVLGDLLALLKDNHSLDTIFQ